MTVVDFLQNFCVLVEKYFFLYTNLLAIARAQKPNVKDDLLMETCAVEFHLILHHVGRTLEELGKRSVLTLTILLIGYNK